jgi:hypothetical protein
MPGLAQFPVFKGGELGKCALTQRQPSGASLDRSAIGFGNETAVLFAAKPPRALIGRRLRNAAGQSMGIAEKRKNNERF